MIKLWEYSAGDFEKDVKYRFKATMFKDRLDYCIGADNIIKLIDKGKLWAEIGIISGRKMNDIEYTIIGEYKDYEDFRDSFVELFI